MSKVSVRSKITMFSIVLAVVALAAIPASSVFAASAKAPAVINHNDMAQVWGSQYRELQADRAFYDKIKAHRDEIDSSLKSGQVQQYLNRYALALSRAEGIVRNTAASVVSKANNQNENTFQEQLAMYLEMMRGLRIKLGNS